LAQHAENHVVSLTDLGIFGPRIEALGVPVSALGLKHGRGIGGASRELRRFARKIQPDIIQGWMYHGNLAATFVRYTTFGKPHLLWNIRQSLDGLNDEKRSTGLVIRAGKLISRTADTILYNSQKARSQHEALGYASSNARVIPNGFDTELWRPNAGARAKTRKELGLTDECILVGFVARFHPMKDLANLLRAISPLMEQNPHIHLAIIGDGNTPDNPALAPLYATLPPANLHILGAQDNVENLIVGFDVFCLSSNSEAFPNVLGEAMSCGVPCIATDVGDAAKVLGDTGIVIPPSKPAALCQALSALIALSPADRNKTGAIARERIVGNYSLRNTVQGYINLYDSILEKT